MTGSRGKCCAVHAGLRCAANHRGIINRPRAAGRAKPVAVEDPAARATAAASSVPWRQAGYDRAQFMKHPRLAGPDGADRGVKTPPVVLSDWQVPRPMSGQHANPVILPAPETARCANVSGQGVVTVQKRQRPPRRPAAGAPPRHISTRALPQITSCPGCVTSPPGPAPIHQRSPSLITSHGKPHTACLMACRRSRQTVAVDIYAIYIAKMRRVIAFCGCRQTNGS
jgi:hypothetical protein